MAVRRNKCVHVTWCSFRAPRACTFTLPRNPIQRIGNFNNSIYWKWRTEIFCVDVINPGWHEKVTIDGRRTQKQIDQNRTRICFIAICIGNWPFFFFFGMIYSENPLNYKRSRDKKSGFTEIPRLSCILCLYVTENGLILDHYAQKSLFSNLNYLTHMCVSRNPVDIFFTLDFTFDDLMNGMRNIWWCRERDMNDLFKWVHIIISVRFERVNLIFNLLCEIRSKWICIGKINQVLHLP